MSTQAQKYNVSLAGEFFVAAELWRRGIHAFVTYGNAKKTDVMIFSGSVATVLEIKSTPGSKWVVGSTVPEPTDKLWIFVHIPHVENESPAYFIATSKELRSILAPQDADYRRRYRLKHRKEFTGKGVVSLRRVDAQPFKSQWSKVLERTCEN